MADRLPKFVVIKPASPNAQCAYYMNDTDEVRGYVSCEEKNVFSPLAKIEVERAKIANKFVHLRFCHTNKYWARRETDHWIFASSDQPEEDTSKLSCTLFEPTIDIDELLYLTHVQSGGRVRTVALSTEKMKLPVYIDDKHKGHSSPEYIFRFVDWETLVKLPRHVTFKGNNGKYLEAIKCEGHPYHQFSSEDGTEERAAYEVHLHPDGHVRIKSRYFGKFWRRSPNWIWADSTDESGDNIDTLFWPVKVDDTTIALRNAGNNYFCKSLTTEGKTSCLNAVVSTIIREARLVLEELVLERNIYNVRYQMENARIFDEKPFVAGIGTATNVSDAASTLAIKVAYQVTSSYSFSNSLSIMAGVKTGIEAGLPGIADGKIEISAEITNSFQWQRTTTKTETAEATYTVSVPAKSRARVNYVGTLAGAVFPSPTLSETRVLAMASLLPVNMLMVYSPVSIITASALSSLQLKL